MTCVSNGVKEVVLEVSQPLAEQRNAILVELPTTPVVPVRLQDLDCVRFLGDICRFENYSIIITEPTLATLRLTVRGMQSTAVLPGPDGLTLLLLTACAGGGDSGTSV
jgi:hypothetical protein